jgi:hypothetical protein
MGKGGCSFGSFFLRQENEHNLLLLFEKKRIFHHPSHIIHHPPSPLGETERGSLPPKQGDRGGLLFFRLEEPGFFFLKVLISVRIGPADVRQMVEVYFRPAA